MARASSRNSHLLPYILAPGLDLVFCGTAPSPVSFKARAYYANPGNAFWPTLHAVGLTPAAMDAASLHAKLRRFRPAAIAFTSKHAAALALGVKAPAYGRQEETLEGAVAFVLASPSGRARSFWTLKPWQEAAAFVTDRRRQRERAA